MPSHETSESQERPLVELSEIQRWVVIPAMKSVPGVVDVNGWGGKTKTYDIAIDQNKLVGNGLSVPQVLTALGNANINVGGQTVNFGAQAAVVRGVGLIHSADEIHAMTLANLHGEFAQIVRTADVIEALEPGRQ